jgi:hypothetical protein
MNHLSLWESTTQVVGYWNRTGQPVGLQDSSRGLSPDLSGRYPRIRTPEVSRP